MENLKMEIYNGVHSCKLNISKEEWLSVLNSPSCKQDYIDKLLLFCDEPDYTASCKHLAEKHNLNAQAINSQITHFGMLASDILNIHIERFEGTKETYWPLPMAKGRDTSDGLFDWTLRSELAEALKDYEILKFKHLLEYFVAHLEYCDNRIESNHGYSTYIKPLIDKKSFKYTGQGYKGNAIQNQIENWSKYSICDICINIQPNYGSNYRTKKCYLHWRDTGINIYSEWNESHIKSLIIGYCYSWNKPCQYEDVVEKQIDVLGLFDDNYPNDVLKDFYNHFKDELEQYYNKEGKYFEEEKKYYENQKTKQTMADIQPKVSLLTTNHNLILTGAPGTGKTYLAKQIAQQLIFGEVKENLTDDEQKQFNEQCGFVQFHPSYDYTDFVEGLRPIQDDNGNVGFERKDGVFKEFCKKALSSGIVQTNIFDDCWDRLIDDIRNNLAIGNLTKIGNWEYGLSSKDSLKHASTTTPSQYSFTITKENVFSAWKGLRARPSGAFQKVMEDVVTFMKSKYNLGNFAFSSEENKNKNFVFIIDEINRGEISKIFGELFFSIDPGYRDKKGKVKTQYQNLIEVGDEFYDGFFVPENVYIIGTMNDIDRSVESMDFAMRRRFAFKEIKADENIEMLEELGELKNQAIERMKRLNAEISKIEGLSSAYHIGAAYFLKLKNYAGDADGGFENLWNNHLEGLLREYLRGSLNIEDSIDKLKAAYNNESTENIG